MTGVDLASPLDDDTVAGIRAAWLEHHVLAFPDQQLSDDDLERFTLAFGPFGDDPFMAPIPGREHIIAIRRGADETSPLFAENWHTDWSFQERPPAGTCLYGITIPPRGGDTLYANQHAALDAMPADLRRRIEGRLAVHSARGGYAPSGLYGERTERPDAAWTSARRRMPQATQLHPIVRQPPRDRPAGDLRLHRLRHRDRRDAGRRGGALLFDLYQWQTRDEFVYHHVWEPGMLVMWDNRSVLHKATGGYDGHDRLLHRTTIGAR